MRVHLPIKTAMEERQARERERYMRPIARAASGDCKMSFYYLYHPLGLTCGGASTVITYGSYDVHTDRSAASYGRSGPYGSGMNYHYAVTARMSLG